MPTVPGDFQTRFAIQNQTTGVVDYLKYTGNQLVASSAHDYGLGSDWKIVAHGDFGANGNELVAQSQSTGKLDFLQIDPNTGNLVSSFMTSYSLPSVHGAGFFGALVPNQVGPLLVSQLANGSIDFLAFDANHNFIASDLVANTVGLPTLIGAGSKFTVAPQFSSLGGTSYSLLTQLADGTLDAIGFSGDFAAGTLSFSSSFLLAQTKGSGKAFATNVSTVYNVDIPSDDGTDRAGVQVLTQSGSNYDALYLDSGYNTTTQGALYGSGLVAGYAGWDVVDIGTDIFAIT